MPKLRHFSRRVVCRCRGQDNNPGIGGVFLEARVIGIFRVARIQHHDATSDGPVHGFLNAPPVDQR